MSVISDVQELYGTLHTTWGKVRVHVISHLIVLSLVYWVGGLAFINFAFPNVSAKEIADNDWFKLAKDMGLIYVLILVPIILVSVYLTVFDFLGGESFHSLFGILFRFSKQPIYRCFCV